MKWVHYRCGARVLGELDAVTITNYLERGDDCYFNCDGCNGQVQSIREMELIFDN